MTLTELQKLCDGISKVSFDEFKFAIRSAAPHVCDDYLGQKWRDFHADPIGFMLSRNPIEQGEALFRIAMGHVRRANTTTEL